MALTLQRPHRGPVTQRYGNIQPDGLPHAGQDYGYSDANGTYPEVYAAADGVVLFAGDSRTLGWPNEFYINPDFNRNDDVDSSAGNLIVIGHRENGIIIAVTGYGHLESYSVRAGQTVSAGQQIGVTGDTGYSFGKHLHFFLMFKPYNYATPTYGCSDPNPYFGNSINYASTKTTPLNGVFDMLTEKQQNDIYWILCTADGREYLAELVGGRAADKTLNTPVARGGQGAGIGDGKTSLAALVSWNDDHTIQTLAAVAAASAQSGASVEQISAAVKAAIAEGVVKVQVSVEGGPA